MSEQFNAVEWLRNQVKARKEIYQHMSGNFDAYSKAGGPQLDKCADEIERLTGERDRLLYALTKSNSFLRGEGIYTKQVQQNNALIAKIEASK